MDISRRDVIDARIKQLEAERAKLDQFGQDEFENGTVLRFKYRFRPQLGPTQWYTYAAIKVKGGWYLSGGRAGRLTWEQLVDFLSRGEVKAKSLKVATAWAGVQ